MATDPIVVPVDAGLAEAEKLFERHQISGLPVLDASGTLVGVISESDLLRARATAYLWASWETLRVKHLMTTPALTIRRGESLTVAARRMSRHHVGRLVVVTDEDATRAIGVIAISDLLRAMGDLTGDAPDETEAPEAARPLSLVELAGIDDRGD
jgi:CBS domain-containing protein